MTVHVKPYQESDATNWDTFVYASRNGTFFHTRRFLVYHPADRFADASLWILDGEKPLAVLPAATKSIDGKKILVAHPGASYGGLVLQKSCGVEDTRSIVDAVTAFARENGYDGLSFLRLTPPSVRSNFSDDQEYWMYQRGWSCTRFEMDGSIDLDGIKKGEALSLLSGKCRNMVRQAERAGVTVHSDPAFETFWPILDATLARHNATPTHSLEEILRLHALSPEHVRLFSAKKDKKLVSGIVLITLNDSSVYTLYMAQNYDFHEYHPLHAILAQILETAIQERRRTVHLGVSTEDGGKVINEGLFFFKESFGCKPVRRESWEIRF
ncbi:MAG: GNAT family N-acetyltransferase [Candidatus Peribacteraceae bacterium]